MHKTLGIKRCKGWLFFDGIIYGALFGGGETPTTQNAIDSVEIATTGNGVDFGDISSSTKTLAGGLSNGHGGLKITMESNIDDD